MTCDLRAMMRNSWISISVAMVSLGSACFAADGPMTQVKTIPLNGVEGRIDHMSITPDGRQFFVAALGNNSVEVADLQGGAQAGRIGDIKEPQGVFYIPDSRKLAVASGGDGSLRVYDAALQPLGTVDGLDDADNVRYDPQAKLLYV